MQEVHALRERKGSDAGLGPLLPRVQTHLQTAATGEWRLLKYSVFNNKWVGKNCEN